MNSPTVSVVMSVYNGADTLARTLQSILDQQGCDFEFIVVNDGSTDGSADILDDWAARDDRLRVIHQQNTGLTRALIIGCAEAQGEFIARQDCGDISLPGRLVSQSAMLQAHPDGVLVACGTRFTAPDGEYLSDVTRPGKTLQEGLAVLDVKGIKGPPHHGGTMFRKATYAAVGGYRAPFVVAQDIDLWLRLSEQGRLIGQADVFYVADMHPGSISNRRRLEQFRLATLAIECAVSRRKGDGDQALIAASRLAPEPSENTGRPISASHEKARLFYFAGSCLLRTDKIAAKRYFRRALSERPFHFRSLVRYFLG